MCAFWTTFVICKLPPKNTSTLLSPSNITLKLTQLLFSTLLSNFNVPLFIFLKIFLPVALKFPSWIKINSCKSTSCSGKTIFIFTLVMTCHVHTSDWKKIFFTDFYEWMYLTRHITMHLHINFIIAAYNLHNVIYDVIYSILCLSKCDMCRLRNGNENMWKRKLKWKVYKNSQKLILFVIYVTKTFSLDKL